MRSFPVVLAWLTVAVWPAFSLTATAQNNPFAANIRTTPALKPEEEQKSFRLPPGFEIQLVAAEPDISKPMNLAFDARGRLWVTESSEYPHPAPPDRPGRDKIKILEDTNGDGRADKITTFAEGLNIPIGIYPYREGAIAYSIPHIWHLEDRDGDGKADRRTKLYGPMGFERDTHGMNNSFRRGYDGWLYACHGFNNETTVKGRDGHVVKMQSGNTYRMRLDGQRVEQFTWGQVNPFGMAIDGYGNLFTADCHSKPIYQLLRGGYYPSFGKPHDGLGFVAPMMDHTHGSTAIAGVAVYDDTNFPEEYRGNLFSGNVMTSRVNRNRMVYHGSTIVAKELPDLVRTTDPWFRPVDVRLGPDGALYVADFYNRIIGHYEVPLDHPGRDRHRGRIWRIVYTGKTNESRAAARPAPLDGAGSATLIAALDHPSLTYRMLAADQLTDRIGVKAADQLKEIIRSPSRFSSRQQAHAMWCLFRLGRLADADHQRALQSTSPLVRIHSFKALAETATWSDWRRQAALKGLGDENAFVSRAAADALGQHPRADQIKPLLEALNDVPQADNHLSHTIRMAVRNQLRAKNSVRQLADLGLSNRQLKNLAPLCLSLPTSGAAKFLADHLATHRESASVTANYLKHAVRYSDRATGERLAVLVTRRFAGQLDQQAQLLESMYQALEVRGDEAGPEVKKWAGRLLDQLIADVKDARVRWRNFPFGNQLAAQNPWGIQNRPSSDGKRHAFISSLVRGERSTGILRSEVFVVPQQLRFYLAGHMGAPQRKTPPRNFVRLRDAQSGQLLREQLPPRHDVAQLVTWNLEKFAGRRGYLEIVDADARAAYAWLAVGRFQPAVVSVPQRDLGQIGARQAAAARIVMRLGSAKHRDWLVSVARHADFDLAARATAAVVLARLAKDQRLDALASLVAAPRLTEAVRRQIMLALTTKDVQQERKKAFEKVAIQLPETLQQQLAQSLAARPESCGFLLDLIREGKLSAHVLRSPVVLSRAEAHRRPEIDNAIKKLTANLPPRSQTATRLIQSRSAGFAAAKASADRGQQVFKKNCSACHQVAGQGKTVGPQLDGIGNRGLQRLLEDLLDPNRNVDVAFRTTNVVTEGGKVLSGLVQREEGKTLLMVDNQGKEFRVGVADIEQRRRTSLSLMPDNMATLLKENEFYDLLRFLLSQRKE